MVQKQKPHKEKMHILQTLSTKEVLGKANSEPSRKPKKEENRAS
jgi:hypothetical protein